jgi:TetR/AcrR family transcriptional repressor of nem operon
LARGTTTRDRLVRTAAELFWTQGYARTGVSSIIKRARATSGSFYHFFPTKEDLLVAVVDLVSDRLESEVLGPAEAASGDVLERIDLVIDAYGDSVKPGGHGFGFPLGILVGELGSNHEVARQRINGLMESLVVRIAGWLTEDADKLAGERDGREVATWVVATLEGAAVLALALRDRASIDAAARWLRRLPDLAVGGALDRGREMRPPPATRDEPVDWKAW